MMSGRWPWEPEDMPKAPPRCTCRDESHNHTIPCFRPAITDEPLCFHCRDGSGSCCPEEKE
jgi:hypothetical protein